MSNHPFKESPVFMLTGIIVALLLSAILGSLSYMYEDISVTDAAITSVVIVVVWGVTYYYSWYLADSVKVWQAWVVLALAVQTVTLFVIYLFLYLFELSEPHGFIRKLPFIFILGLQGWIIIMQWFDSQKKKEKPLLEEIDIPQEQVTDKKEFSEKISVKDGTRIHIIPVKDLVYIQASGDYVSLFTENGQFIKEFTMKSLESGLPLNFVRIHRSCIINADRIQRIELFGKESYHVRMKNGAKLKASLTGYKLLKERLHL